MMNGWGMGGWMAGMGFVWLILILLAVAFIVLGIVMAKRVSSTGGSSPPHNGSKSALEILDERYAGGEISRKEYDEMRRTLER
ncbi:hypothetical protein GC175_14855 [bacterium]|nr:hypothetical protein [bacterium]